MPNAGNRLLIFNADDYGLSPGVSAGILECTKALVRSTSVMANWVTEEDAQSLCAAQSQGRIRAAAHLNLSSGRPLSPGYPKDLLDPQGRFIKHTALDAATWESAHFVEAAEQEWRKQIWRITELGIVLSHIDSHHHTHLLPGLFPTALALAAELGLGLRVREGQRDAARARRITCPDCFMEGYFGYNFIDRANLVNMLEGAKAGAVEIMCHPGRVDVGLRQRSGYLIEREIELGVLGDPGLAEELCELGWRIGSYADLPQ